MLKIKDWQSFQHYKDRNPPWIKLQTDTFQNYDFSRLQSASKLLAICIWTLASRSKDGTVPHDFDYIKTWGQLGKDVTENNLKELINKGYLIDDSNALADCKQSAIPETEAYSKETYRKETEKKDTSCASDFETFWTTYPKNNGSKQEALKKYGIAIKSGITSEQLIAGARAYADYVAREGTERRFIAHAATWLHQRRWEIEYTADKPKAAKQPTGKQTWSSAGAELIAKYEREAELERGRQIESGKNNINLIASS